MKTQVLIICALLFTAVTITVLSENAGTRATVYASKVPAKPHTEVRKPVAKVASATRPAATPKPATPVQVQNPDPPKCVFKTTFEGAGISEGFYYKIPGRVMASMDKGLEWLEDAQNKDGGWGAGTHSRQDVMDPHAVQSDPATTAMVAMAMQRAGSGLDHGAHAKQLRGALDFLLICVETADANATNITLLTNTQPQIKLGRNIDVVLTSQFLTNILDETNNNQQLRQRVKKCISKCVGIIQDGQEASGAQQGSGWAGVLQSSFAASALESARNKGVKVDEEALENSRNFQKQNIDPATEDVITESAAGVVLYSVSGSTRATAAESAEAKEAVRQAKADGKIKDESVTVDNLKKAGMSDSKAMKYSTAYRINQSAKRLAQDDKVISGFGNNGGEEFLSYLQTGEGLIIGKDMDWKQWYDKTSGRLLNIQNRDGSWNGHHCITSPVFCTATCLLILSVNNDIDNLLSQANQN